MVEYDYDAFGRRNTRKSYKESKRKHDDKTLNRESNAGYIYDSLGFNVIGETTETKWRHDTYQNPAVEYVYAKGQQLSMTTLSDHKGKYNNPHNSNYYHLDLQGSVMMLTSQNGHVEKKYTYDAFGTNINYSKQSIVNFGYNVSAQ